jgi:hypothetical protein
VNAKSKGPAGRDESARQKAEEAREANIDIAGLLLQQVQGLVSTLVNTFEKHTKQSAMELEANLYESLAINCDKQARFAAAIAEQQRKAAQAGKPEKPAKGRK